MYKIMNIKLQIKNDSISPCLLPAIPTILDANSLKLEAQNKYFLL